jgi:hypothetical protein
VIDDLQQRGSLLVIFQQNFQNSFTVAKKKSLRKILEQSRCVLLSELFRLYRIQVLPQKMYQGWLISLRKSTFEAETVQVESVDLGKVWKCYRFTIPRELNPQFLKECLFFSCILCVLEICEHYIGLIIIEISRIIFLVGLLEMLSEFNNQTDQ